MLWWFLILGVSTAVVVSVAVLLYMRVRRQLKNSAAMGTEEREPKAESQERNL